MNRLREIIISITNRCNLHCRMCDIPLKKSKELPTETWEHVIEDACKLKANAIVFSGGEPLLREDIFDLISYSKHRNIGVCITSNGILMSEKTVKEVKRRGVDVVNISIEGNSKIHNYLRGQGTFDKAISALNNLRRYGVETTIAVMVSGYNYSYLPYLAKIAKEYGVTTIKLQPFSDIFISSDKNKNGFFVRAKDSGHLLYSIREFISLCNKYGVVTNPLNYLEKMYNYLLNRRIDRRNGCDALWYSCPVNSQGEVYPCWRLAEEKYIIGNVSRESLVDIWGSSKRRDIIALITKEGCPGCIMSCYDRIFNEEKLTNRITIFRERTMNERLRFALRSLGRRIHFYISYRDSFKNMVGRLFDKKAKAVNTKIDISEEEAKAVIDEIEESKELIKKELSQ